MTTKKSLFKGIALIMIMALSFQSLSEINNHTYTTGITTIHANVYEGITCYIAGCGVHSMYSCGKTFHY